MIFFAGGNMAGIKSASAGAASMAMAARNSKHRHILLCHAHRAPAHCALRIAAASAASAAYRIVAWRHRGENRQTGRKGMAWRKARVAFMRTAQQRGIANARAAISRAVTAAARARLAYRACLYCRARIRQQRSASSVTTSRRARKHSRRNAVRRLRSL